MISASRSQLADFHQLVLRVFSAHPTAMGRPIRQVDPVPFATQWGDLAPWMRNHYRKLVHSVLQETGLVAPPLAEVLEFGETELLIKDV